MLSAAIFPEDVGPLPKKTSCETEELDGHVVGDYQQL